MSPNLILIRAKLEGAAAVKAGMESMGSSGVRMGKEVKSGADKVNAALSKVKKKTDAIKHTGRSLTTAVTLPVIGLGLAAINTAANFDKSMAQVGVATHAPAKEMKSLRALAIETGQKTIFSANDSAEAMLELAKSGISPAKIEAGALAATMSLAATEGLELGRTAEIVGAALNTFGLKASESQRIGDALAGGANASSASVSGLAESLSQGGQSAAMYGISLEEAVGSLAAFAQNGIQASDAGTSFKTFMMRLNPTQKKQKELMDQLNLTFFDQTGHMVGMTKIAGKLRTALSGYSQQQRGAYLQTLFGSDAMRAANIVYKEGPKGIEKYIKATERKGGAEEMANAQMKGLPGAIERLKGSLETAALVAGNVMAPVVIELAGFIEGLANKFSELPAPIKKWIIIGLVAAAVLGPALWIIGTVLSSLITIISAVTTVVGFLGVALAFLAANPIVLAVLVLAAGFAYLYWKVEWFHNAVDAIVKFVKAHWRTLLPLFIAPFFPLLGVLVLVVTHLAWFKNAFNNVVAFFKALPGRIMAGIKKLPHLIGSIVAKMVVFWATLPVRIMLLQLKFVKLVVHTTLTLGPKLLSAGVTILGKFLNGIEKGWEAVHTWFMGLPGKFASWISSIAPQLVSMGGKIASEMWKGFKESLPGPLKEGLNLGGEIASEAGGIAGDVGSFVNPFDNAKGTNHFAGGWSWVGEEGPELLRLPRGSQVKPVTSSAGSIRIPPPADVSRGDGEDPFWSRDIVIPVTVKMDSQKVASGVAKASQTKKARD